MKKNATYHYYVEGEDEKSLMDALKRACEIRNIGELTNSKTTTDYKRDLIACTNLGTRCKFCLT